MEGTFFAYLARMRYIRRWGLMRSTEPENVQEHSHMVAVLAHALAVIRRDVMGVPADPERAATAALFHDAPEILTGDLPTPVKYFDPELRAAYGRVEELSVEKLLTLLPEELRPAYAPWLREEYDGETRALVKAADKLSANGLMSGTSATIFAPSTQLSRAMMVQILYNLEDRPAAAESAAFTDVAADAWYADAVNWAAGAGIVSGYGNGKFGPDDLITREQMANMLYYYAQWAGLEPSAGADALQGFQDAGQVSSWASDAVSWAVSSGLISGTGNQTLAPTATATRAEVAQIMMAFRKGQA